MLPSGRRLDRATALFISLLAVGFLVATFDVRASGDSATTVLRGGAQTLAEPIQSGIDFVVRPVVGFVDGISNVAGLRDQNERLEAEVERLEARLRETSALEQRVAELEAINDLAPPEGLATVTARIYSSGPSTFDQVRFINKGSSDGVIVGQAVIDESGLVGRVDGGVANGAPSLRDLRDADRTRRFSHRLHREPDGGRGGRGVSLHRPLAPRRISASPMWQQQQMVSEQKMVDHLITGYHLDTI